jgi:hypothetical protein
MAVAGLFGQRRKQMDKNTLDFAFAIMTAVGTFCTGIAAFAGVFKVIKSVTYRNEVLYGEEALERFRKIEHSLPRDRLIGVYPFAGGHAAIIPQLKVTRLRYNPQTMPGEYRNCTQTLRYITRDETGSPIEKVWALK